MVDVTEPTRIQRKLDRQWALLGESEIDGRDKDAIETFVNWRRDIDGVSRNTRMQDLSVLRLSSRRAEMALVEMGLADVERLLSTLAQPEERGGYGYDPEGTTMFAYCRALRIFFRYMDKREGYAEYPWHDEIELPDIELQGAAKRDEMLTGDEVEAMKQAANHARDRALIAFLADMAGRIGLILSLRVCDVFLDGDEPFFVPNDEVEDGLKGLSSDEIPILHSRGEVRAYLRNYHPEPDVGEAPLWPHIRGYTPENRQQCAVGDSRVREMLRDCAKRAGIDKPVEPHHFRRTGVTRLSNSERLPPQDIMQITGWSSQTLMQMLDVYDYTTDAERNSGIHQSLGFSEGQVEDDDLQLASKPCGTCREIIQGGDQYCSNCGAPRDEEARAAKRELVETTGERTATAEGSDGMNYEMMRRWAEDNPEQAVQAMFEGVNEGSGEH